MRQRKMKLMAAVSPAEKDSPLGLGWQENSGYHLHRHCSAMEVYTCNGQCFVNIAFARPYGGV